jgi:predicted nucleic-acid-binding protein
MKGLDTNVLVRYLTQDDPKQAALASKTIEEAAAKKEKLLLQPLVFCELIWVLETAYGFPKGIIVKVLGKILRTAEFEISEKDLLWLALADYHSGKGDFSDYYLGRANERPGTA